MPSNAGKLASPSIVKATNDLNLRAVATRIAQAATPMLQQAQECRAVGRVFAAGAASVDSAKDIHGVAEAVRDAARSTQRAQGAARALQAASAHARIAGQMGLDLARMRVEVAKAEEAVRVFRSPAAQSALQFLRPSVLQAQVAFESERYFQIQFQSIARRLRDGRSSALGEAALAAEKVASKSSIGRGLLATGRLVTRSAVGNALIVVGIGVASFNGYKEAPTRSVPWKAGFGAAAGAASMLTEFGPKAAVMAGRANPAALLFDPAVKYGARAMGYGAAGEHLTVETFYQDCSRSIMALTHGLMTGDAEAISETHRRNMAGNGHLVTKGYAMLGEALSRSALIDTAMTKSTEWYANVPEDFKTASSWWDAIASDAGTLAEIGRGIGLTIKEKLGRDE